MNINLSFALSEEEYDSNGSHHDDQMSVLQRTLFFVGIPIIILGVLLNLLLIFVILKFKALKIRSNYYILNYAICNIAYLTADYILNSAMNIFFGGFLEIRWYCTFIQVEYYFINMCLIFIAGYSLDEYVVLSCGEYFQYMYKNGYKYITGSTYLLHFILAFIFTSVCFQSRWSLRLDIGLIFVSIVTVILFIITLKLKYDSTKSTRYVNNKHLGTAINITILIFLFVLPQFIFHYIRIIIVKERLESNKEIFDILDSIGFILRCMSYCTTLLLTYMLYKFNKFFKLAFCKVVCKSRRNMDYDRLDVAVERDVDVK